MPCLRQACNCHLCTCCCCLQTTVACKQSKLLQQAHVALHHLLPDTSNLELLQSTVFVWLVLDVCHLMAAAEQDAGDSAFWSAKVGNTRPDDEGTNSTGSSRVAPDVSSGPAQAVLLVPVQMTAGAGECVQHVVGAWLQSILRKYAIARA